MHWLYLKLFIYSLSPVIQHYPTGANRNFVNLLAFYDRAHLIVTAMKLRYIVGLLAVAAAVGIIVSSTGSASQYVNFAQAAQLAAQGDDSKVHVVGELPKNPSGEVTGVEYEPLKDANYLAFDLRDDQGQLHRVVCTNPPPSMQDFKRSEKVVVIGRMRDQQFVASEILMKCPSKYEEKELKAEARP
jgi:cytochrome c-type biogenesis protein CcmE